MIELVCIVRKRRFISFLMTYDPAKEVTWTLSNSISKRVNISSAKVKT